MNLFQDNTVFFVLHKFTTDYMLGTQSFLYVHKQLQLIPFRFFGSVVVNFILATFMGVGRNLIDDGLFLIFLLLHVHAPSYCVLLLL